MSIIILSFICILKVKNDDLELDIIHMTLD